MTWLVLSPRVAVLAGSVFVAAAAACAEGQPDPRSAAGKAEPTGPAAPPPVAFEADASFDADGGFQTGASVAVEAKREVVAVELIWIGDT